MKILILTERIPWPPDTGSKQIVYNQVRVLSRSHKVTLVCFRHPDSCGTGDLEKFCTALHVLGIPPTRRVLVNALAGVLRDVPLSASLYTSRATSAAIARVFESDRFDAVISRIELARFIPERYAGATILSLEDPEPLKFARIDKRGWPWHRKIFGRLEHDRHARYERRMACRFDCVTMISQQDLNDYREQLGTNRLACIPYGTDAIRFCPSESVPRCDGMMVLSGNMYHPPNIQAARYFCREIYPLVKAQVPGASLWIVGARPAPEILRLREAEGIVVTGTVPEIRDYLQRARVSVCPVLLPIGVQTKVLEAMACATPVVTTPEGNRGIGAVSGQGLYVAASTQEFAARVASLLRGENWDAMSRAARQFILDHFTWEKSVERLETLIRRICQERTEERVNA